MIPEFDQFPVFYFSNHQAIQGPGKVYAMEKHFDRMDFELEVAIVIKKEGINIKAEHADEYIGGFMVLNDLSARAGLRVGQKIALPKTISEYRIKRGDTLIGLATRYGVETGKLAEMNDLQPNTQLRMGEVIKVPNL